MCQGAFYITHTVIVRSRSYDEYDPPADPSAPPLLNTLGCSAASHTSTDNITEAVAAATGFGDNRREKKTVWRIFNIILFLGKIWRETHVVKYGGKLSNKIWRKNPGTVAAVGAAGGKRVFKSSCLVGSTFPTSRGPKRMDRFLGCVVNDDPVIDVVEK